MGHRRSNISIILCSILMVVLILDSKTALKGASEGIHLCIYTVIPALFPFILLSSQIMAAFSGRNWSFLRPMGKLFSLPKGFESILIPAFLGGYPVGAQCIAREYSAGRVSKETAHCLLAFCNNAGPSFLFGMVGQMFSKKWMIWALWGIQFLSAMLVSALFPCTDSGKLTAKEAGKPIMAASVQVMGIICGWVLLFRVILAFLDRWFLWLLPVKFKVVLTGFLELTNGCCSLSRIHSEEIRFILCAGIVSFGGICVLMQTSSVIQGLSIRYYLLGKLLQTGISILLAMGFLWNPWVTISVVSLSFVFCHGKTRNYSRNSAVVGV